MNIFAKFYGRELPISSKLYDQNSFYEAFLKDLNHARKVVIIESPFISTARTCALLPVLSKLAKRGVKIVVNTKCLDEHSGIHREYVTEMIAELQNARVTVLYTSGHHRKLAMIDDKILWEGSLNILSHFDSCEIMRRINSASEASNMKSFIKIKNLMS